MGGLWGTLAIGLQGSASASAGVDGLLYGGGLDQLGRQAVGALVVLTYSFGISLALGWLIQRFWGFRLGLEHEVTGIDSVEHAETADELDSLGGGAHLPARAQSVAEARLP